MSLTSLSVQKAISTEDCPSAQMSVICKAGCYPGESGASTFPEGRKDTIFNLSHSY